MEPGEHREMFAKAHTRDNFCPPWVQAGEMGWTGEGLRRQNGLEVGQG